MDQKGRLIHFPFRSFDNVLIFKVFPDITQLYYDASKLKSFIYGLCIYSNAKTLSLSNTEVIIWFLQHILSETLKLLSRDLLVATLLVKDKIALTEKKKLTPLLPVLFVTCNAYAILSMNLF